MANEGIITVTGNLGSDAELRKTPNGKLVTSFNLCNTPRTQVNGEWQDGEPIWFRCFVWGKDATGAANELRKGNRVVITGRFNLDKYVDKEGAERRTLQINVDSYGVTPKNIAESSFINADIATENPIEDPWG